MVTLEELEAEGNNGLRKRFVSSTNKNGLTKAIFTPVVKSSRFRGVQIYLIANHVTKNLGALAAVLGTCLDMQSIKG